MPTPTNLQAFSRPREQFELFRKVNQEKILTEKKMVKSLIVALAHVNNSAMVISNIECNVVIILKLFLNY